METLSKNSKLKIDKDKIVKEVDKIVESIFQAWGEMNVDKAFVQNFSKTSEFNFIGIDGAILNHEEMLTEVKEHFAMYDKFNLEIKEKKYNVIDVKTVLASLRYGGYCTIKENRIDFPNVGATMVFRKTKDKWLIIHFQESTQLNQ